MKTSVRLLWLVLPFLGCVLLAGGCWVPLTGAGQAGIGYSSTSRVFLYHEVDGDKDGKKSEARLEMDPFIQAWLGDLTGGSDEPEAEICSPATDG